MRTAPLHELAADFASCHDSAAVCGYYTCQHLHACICKVLRKCSRPIKRDAACQTSMFSRRVLQRRLDDDSRVRAPDYISLRGCLLGAAWCAYNRCVLHLANLWVYSTRKFASWRTDRDPCPPASITVPAQRDHRLEQLRISSTSHYFIASSAVVHEQRSLELLHRAKGERSSLTIDRSR